MGRRGVSAIHGGRPAELRATPTGQCGAGESWAPQEDHAGGQLLSSNWGSEPLIPEEEDPTFPRPHGRDTRGHELRAALTTLLPGPRGFKEGAPAGPLPYTQCSQTIPNTLSSVVPKASGYDLCGHPSDSNSGKPAHIPEGLGASRGRLGPQGFHQACCSLDPLFPYTRRESSRAGEACFSSSQACSDSFSPEPASLLLWI